jgi:hypothetical protein
VPSVVREGVWSSEPWTRILDEDDGASVAGVSGELGAVGRKLDRGRWVPELSATGSLG